MKRQTNNGKGESIQNVELYTSEKKENIIYE